VIATALGSVIALLDVLTSTSEEEKPQQKSYTYPQTLIQRQRPVPGQYSIGRAGQYSIGADSQSCSRVSNGLNSKSFDADSADRRGFDDYESNPWYCLQCLK
jgi:hypothetical protein